MLAPFCMVLSITTVCTAINFLMRNEHKYYKNQILQIWNWRLISNIHFKKRNAAKQSFKTKKEILIQIQPYHKGHSNKNDIMDVCLLPALLNDMNTEFVWQVKVWNDYVNLFPNIYNHISQLKHTFSWLLFFRAFYFLSLQIICMDIFIFSFVSSFYL